MARRPQLNPRQRRGLALLALAAVGAALVYRGVDRYVTEVQSRVGPLVPALQLRTDVAAFDPVSPTALTRVMVPRRWLSRTALTDPAALEGLVATADLRAGSYLQRDMVGDAPAVGPGEREVTLTVRKETVPADVRRNSLVDVLATYDKGKAGAKAPQSRVVVNNARVLEVERGKDSDATVTFAADIKESQALNLAESYATRVRLVLNGHDSPDVPAAQRSYSGG